jgi:nitronate monooxygenase
MALRTRLTQRLSIEHPILSAPMAGVAGGRLAAAVTDAGGLGLIGGGYGDAGWLEREFAEAGNARVGCGFITWSLAKQPHLLDVALAHAPAAVMLSFGAPAPFASAIRASGAHLICQVQTIAHTREAVAAGADIIVAQGGEAGGHGGARSTLTLVPEVADLLAEAAPDAVLVAAGGIADGRGLAAALMLGAEGVLIGSRFLLSKEIGSFHSALQEAIRCANGDATVKTTVLDVVRKLNWPPEITGRALRNTFVERWHGNEVALAVAVERELENYVRAREAGDAAEAGIFVGEAAGLMHEVRSAADIVQTIAAEAEQLLAARGNRLPDAE